MAVVNDNQLTDVPTLKSWLSIALTDTAQDTNFERLIITVSQTFKSLIRRPVFLASAVTETHRGNGSSRIFLKVQPVVSITSVEDANGNIISLTPDFYQTTGYSFDSFGLLFPFGTERFKSYTVDYIGGVLPDSPEALMAEQAVLSLCALWWKRRTHTDEINRSLGQQITARFTQEELPPETQVIVRQLKRMT